MFDIIGRRRWFYLFSGIVTVVGVAFILLTFLPGTKLGLQFSIAYTGGTIWEVHFRDGTPSPDGVLEVLADQGLAGSEVAITTATNREYVLIRTKALALREPQGPTATAEPTPSAEPTASAPPDASTAPDPSAQATALAQASSTPDPTAGTTATAQASSTPDPTAGATATAQAPSTPDPTSSAGASSDPSPHPSASPGASLVPGTADGGEPPVQGVPTEGEFGALAAALQEVFGPIDEVRQANTVGPVVSTELIGQTFLLILVASLAIMGWITFRFHDFRMGVTAIIALLHDVIVVVGAFAVLGTITGMQIDALFVTAMLTVIGFSVHDTIVVFDRIRENRVRHAGETLEVIVNHSILQTLGRSINTSLTVVITLSALLLLGGEAIRPFVLALLIGIVSGTYSSIFNASPLFLDWHLWDDRRRARRLAVARAT